MASTITPRVIGRLKHGASRARGAMWRLKRALSTPPRPLRVTAVPADVETPEHGDGLSFAAVIPVVHPEHANVRDYAVVDGHLELTTRSIARQRGRRVVSVIIGHRRPDWLTASERDCLFIDINASREVRGQLTTPIDKGIKMLLGALVARDLFGTDVALTVDADDFVAEDIAMHIEDHLHNVPASNGISWTRGYELVSAPSDRDSDVCVDTAYLVEAFDRSCGTSRAITMRRIEATMARAISLILPVAESVAAQVRSVGGAYVVMDASAATLLDAAVADLTVDAHDELDHLGRHITAYFDLDSLPLLGAAKICGHGQHDGPRGGGVHWQRIVRRERTDTVLRRFGLQGVDPSVVTL